MSNSLMHYGTPRHSGRYPYGSGERPYQHSSLPEKFSYNGIDKLEELWSRQDKDYDDLRSKYYEESEAIRKKYKGRKNRKELERALVKAEHRHDKAQIELANRHTEEEFDLYRNSPDKTLGRRAEAYWLATYDKRRFPEGWTVEDVWENEYVKPLKGKSDKEIDEYLDFYSHSDEGGEDFMYVDNLLDRSDELMHYGTPRHSGRYPWGSGERPFQRQGGTRLHNYMSSDKLNSIHKQEEKKILKEAGYSSREEFKDKFLEGMRTGSPVKLTSDDVKVLSELNKLDKEYNKASKKSKRLDKHVDMTMNNMGRFWNHDEYATADARARRKINDYEKKEGHKLTEDEKQRVLLEEYRKIKKRRTALAVGSAAAGVAAATVAPELLLSPLAYVYYSDTDQNDYMAALLDKADDLTHYGTPRHSGRYPWGSGERPFQGDGYLALPAGSSYHSGHKSTRKSKASSGSAGASKSQNSNSTDSEEAQYKRNEERRKQQKHDADMADRARKIRKEDAKEKADKEKADKKEREDLEDAYWKEVTNMTSQLASIRTHAKNLKAASKPVKDVTKKMSDQQLKELTDRLKLENSYLRELNTKQGYMAQPDKLDNFIGLMGDITSMGRSASKVYRTANKQRKYL